MWSYKMTYSSSGLFNMVLLMCALKTFARSIDNENSHGYRREIEHVLDEFHRRLLNEAERLTQFEDGLHVDHSRGFQQHGYPTADFVTQHQVDNLRRHDDHRIKSQPNRNKQIEISYVSNIDESNVERNMHEFGRNHERNGSYRDNSEYNENVNRNQQNRGVINNPVREDNLKDGSCEESSEEIDGNSRLDKTSCNTTDNKQDKVSNRTLEKQHTNIEVNSNSGNYSSKTVRTNKPPAISGVNRQYNGKEYTIWPNDADYEKTTKAYEIKKNSTEPVKSTHKIEVTPKSAVKGSNVSEIDGLEDRIALDAPCPDGKKRVNGYCVEIH